MNWEEVQKNYPVNQEWIWMNNCGTTPIGTHVLKRLSLYWEGYSRKGIFSEVESFAVTKSAILRILSKLLDVKESELALIHNTSEGMNFLSRGVDLKSGDEILLLEDEYPSNVYPWEHWKSKGVSIEFLASGQTPEECLSNFQSKISSKTKLVSLSTVHWCTGLPLPIREISEICKEKGIFFFLDGAQGVGQIPIHLSEIHADGMAFPAWKWLLGPLGLGVLYIRESSLQKIHPIFKGTDSVRDSINYFPYRDEWKDGTSRFEFSTPSFQDWVYFRASLEYLEEIGFSNVRNRIHELVDDLRSRLEDLGMNCFPGQGVRSGILVAGKQGYSSTQIVGFLKENGIITADRLGGVRFSPHIYNSSFQMELIHKKLKSLLK